MRLTNAQAQLYEHFRDRPFLAGEIPKMLEEVDIPLDTTTPQGHVVEDLLCKVLVLTRILFPFLGALWALVSRAQY
jgi:hypothetical protein